ncbi:Ig-like domain-containing protein [Streptomyces peucetius]|uniref:Ig-like domain-containing protein n=1 Tax=Streptomyces peucetius TaxID=1950 RepID=A0ABY6IJW1_STRPE|nr:Ig-like domain-containing protein [Streptomyces peucetius]UYQ65980.1 Ig-like domain-containing protein [Streptomyces peucetius]
MLNNRRRRRALTIVSSILLVLQALVFVGPAPAWAGQDQALETGFEPHNATANPRKPSQVAVMRGCTVRIDNNFGKDGFPITRTSTLPCSGDPSLAFDSQGRLFVTHLSTSFNTTPNRFGVGVGQINDLTTTGNQTYTPVQVSANSPNNQDKQWLVADANPTSPYRDNLYVVWSDLGTPWEIQFSRLESGATNWSAPQVLSTAGDGNSWPSHAAVGPNGDLYVAYHADICDEGTDGAPGAGTVQLLRDGSGGADFAAGTVPQRTSAFGPGQASVSCNVQDNSGGEIPGTDFWLQGSMQPWVLPDPARPGNVYVVANDDPNDNFGNGDDGDVRIARSTDNGVSFGPPTRVDHGPGQTLAVMPTAHLDQDGNLVAHWYDNRSGERNGGTGPNGNDNFLLEVYGTTSRDGGLTWSQDFRISDAPFDPDLNARCRFGPTCPARPADPEQTLRIGEYNGVWTVDGIGYATWTGNATPPTGGNPAAGNQTTYYDTFSLLGAFPDTFEPNESIDTAVAAALGSDDRFNGGRLSLHSATDVDFFRVVPRHTGHLAADIAFNEVISGLQVRAYDKFGNKVSTGTVATMRPGSSTSRLAIPVVEDEPYFIVVSDSGITDPTKPGDASPTDPPQATYDLSLVNREAPEPFGLDLKRESDSGRFDNDDVTSTTGPEIFLRVDDADLRAANIPLSPENGTSTLVDDGPGFKVAVERDGERVGFAQPVNPVTKPGLYATDLDPVLTEGENLITAEVIIVDPSDDPAVPGTAHVVGSGPESAHRLGITLDTTAPAAPAAAPDLLSSSDTGGNSIDNITTITEPAFQGSPVEPNALVRLTADPPSATGPTVVGKDTVTSAGGYEVVSDPLDDGTYDFAVRLEDLAGNVSAPSPSLAATIANQSLTLTGATQDLVLDVDQNTVTGYPGIPGGFVGVRGIPVVNLDAAGHEVAIQGGAGDESLTFTPTSANSGRLTRSNSAQVLNFTGVTGDVAVNPDGGDDEVTIVGTTGVDSVFGTVDLLTLLRVQGLLGLEITTDQTERIGVSARGGRDTVDITAMEEVSALLSVNSGPPNTAAPPQGDTLIVRGGSPKDQLVNVPGGPFSGEGSAFVRYPHTTGAETRIDYTETERVILDHS